MSPWACEPVVCCTRADGTRIQFFAKLAPMSTTTSFAASSFVLPPYCFFQVLQQRVERLGVHGEVGGLPR
jgi:hypothetical protein